MKRYNPEIHHRNSIRLKGYDYSTGGMYFVTVCTQGHENLFGRITDNVMYMNDAGRMVESVWSGLSGRYPFVTMDAFTVMPNHFHGIIRINNEIESDPVGALLAAPSIAAPSIAAPSIAAPSIDAAPIAAPHGENKGVVEIADADNSGERMGPANGLEKKGAASSFEKKGAASSFEKKGAASSARTTTLGQIVRAFKSISAIQVNRIMDRRGRPLWHRNYYERIIRDERELNNIREYIISNPAQWAEDPENR
jgi:REP element-mobilizing transposase RayT